MLAFPAPVDQPNVDAVPVGIYPEFAGIDKFLFFSAASAAVIYTDRAAIRAGRLPARSVIAHTFLPYLFQEPSELMK